MTYQTTFVIATPSRGTTRIDDELAHAVRASGVVTGVCHVFVRHTSASLILCENTDPAVRADLERFLARLIPDGDPLFEHVDEGPDDLPAHIRSMLTKMDLTLPVSGGGLATGVWQGVYLYEHRTHPQRREVVVSVW